MNGIVVIDKPAGMTSHDVVARCRRALGVKRIGHAGTLDPGATGVLVIGVGRATRLLRFLEAHDKTYEATVTFGVTTTTFDADGDPIEECDASGLSRATVEAALDALRGEIDQVPPMVSAVKVGGERLYAKARRGEEVERAPRRVTIHELRLDSFEPATRPVARLVVRCSKGTYVRSLAADLGEAVGTGAHLAALRRTAVGPFTLARARGLDGLTSESLEPMERAATGYPVRRLDAAQASAVVDGRPLGAAGIAGTYAMVGPAGLVAMAEDREGVARTLCVVSER